MSQQVLLSVWNIIYDTVQNARAVNPQLCSDDECVDWENVYQRLFSPMAREHPIPVGMERAGKAVFIHFIQSTYEEQYIIAVNNFELEPVLRFGCICWSLVTGILFITFSVYLRLVECKLVYCNSVLLFMCWLCKVYGNLQVVVFAQDIVSPVHTLLKSISIRR